MSDDRLLVVGGDVVTMDRDRSVVTGATVAVRGGRIVAVGAELPMRDLLPGAAVIDARGCLVVPGLVNAHQHTTMDPLVRSTIPDELDAHTAVHGWAVPLHAHTTPDDDEVSATLTAVECLTRGITTLLEAGTVAHPDRVARGLATAGIRARVGCWGWDTEGAPHALPTAEVLARQEETVMSLSALSALSAPSSLSAPSVRSGGPAADEGLVTGWITLVGHDLASDDLLTGAAALAERLDTHLTWHISPDSRDTDVYLERTGARPVEHFHRIGVLGPRLLLGHAVWMSERELELVLDTRTAVASCPAACLRLGQGYTRASRHTDLVRRGGRLALGCDSHNAGDTPDILRAAWLTAALDRDRGIPEPLRADQVFALATVDGAEAVGLGHLIGSIEPGKAADLVVIDATGPAWTPRGDPALQLVWGAASDSVRDVVVAGRVVVRDGRPTTLDLPALLKEATDRSSALLRRSGIDAPRRWPERAAARTP